MVKGACYIYLSVLSCYRLAALSISIYSNFNLSLGLQKELETATFTRSSYTFQLAI